MLSEAKHLGSVDRANLVSEMLRFAQHDGFF